MNTVSDLLLSPIAFMFLPKIVEAHDCGFNDGGCYSFAQAIHLAFPQETQTFGAYSADGILHHGLVKVNGSDKFGDSRGWQTFNEFQDNFLKDEGVVITHVELLDFSAAKSKAHLFADIVTEISSLIKNNEDVSFNLPLDSNDIISIGCGLFERDTAYVTSDVCVDCEGLQGAFIDGIESLVLGHFCSGVDVFSSEYCDGILSALEAGFSALPDCTCLQCVTEDASTDNKVLIFRSREITLTANENLVYTVDKDAFDKFDLGKAEDYDQLVELLAPENQVELERSSFDIEPKEVCMVHHESLEFQ